MWQPAARKPEGRHPHQRLTAVHVRSLKKAGRYADGHGLYLFVDKNGAKRWIWRGVIRGKRCDLGIGPVALVTLADARAEAVRIKTIAWKGGDPRAERRRERRGTLTFKEAAKQVHAAHAATFKNEKHKAQWLSSLEANAFPVFGSKAVDTIDSADVLKALSAIWTAKPETARRLKQRVKVVLDWAKASGYRTGDNPVDGVAHVLPRHKAQQTHHPALPYAEVPAFIETIRKADTSEAIKLAFEFLILTAARTSEVLGARWDEIDLESKTWTIPGVRIKAGREHRVPLSARCLEILKRAEALADGGPFVFPGRSPKATLSNMAFLMLLRRMERTDITAHGFRSSFRDWAAEKATAPRTVVEAALAHVVKDKTEAAYFRSDLFELRRKLMDNWTKFVTSSPAKILTMEGRRDPR
jgi:integrase